MMIDGYRGAHLRPAHVPMVPRPARVMDSLTRRPADQYPTTRRLDVRI